MKELIIILIRYIISALLYVPIGAILLPFCILKHICDVIYNINEKIIELDYKIFIETISFPTDNNKSKVRNENKYCRK